MGGLTFAFGSPPWGAHPGSAPQDIQSGTGFVHNTAMREGIEKVPGVVAAAMRG